MQTVTVTDHEPPAISCPADLAIGCSVERLVPLSFAATGTDNCDPQPVITYSTEPGSGFPVGVTTVTTVATDASGNQADCSFTVTREALGFEGFLPPIDGADATGGSFADPLRTFKLGSTVPIKFRAFCAGAPVTTGVHTLQVVKWSNDTEPDTPIDATPQDEATSGNQFRLADDQWHFNLDTQATGMSVGKWQIAATLSDGSRHVAWIQLK
jgi:hypothetical protein